MSDNEPNEMKNRAKEGLLRLGVTDNIESVDNPIENYVETYNKHITYHVPVTEDYLPNDYILISDKDYPVVDDLSDIFERENAGDAEDILVYDEDEMVMPHIVEVEREEHEDEEEEDEYNLTLHMAHQDSAWYLRNRIVSSRKIFFGVDLLLIVTVFLCYYLMPSAMIGMLIVSGILTLSVVGLIYLIPITILSLIL